MKASAVIGHCIYSCSILVYLIIVPYIASARNLNQLTSQVIKQHSNLAKLDTVKPNQRRNSTRGGLSLVTTNQHGPTLNSTSSHPIKQMVISNASASRIRSRVVVWDGQKNEFVVDHPSKLLMSPPPKAASLWPMPYRVEEDISGSRVYNIIPACLNVISKHSECDVIAFNVLRLWQTAFGRIYSASSGRDKDALTCSGKQSHDIVQNIHIKVRSNCETRPRLGMNESYSLKTTLPDIVLEADTVWGVIRGLETLGQRIVFNENQNRFDFHYVDVYDTPRFKYRATMIDTARHFISKKTLIQNFEAMALNKMNVFHWHLVDDQSFPYVSSTFPELSQKGAYHANATYSVTDVQDILTEAAMRGIIVVPEFDTPAHSFSWGFSHPNITTACNDGKTTFNGPMNPIRNETYAFLKKLYMEIYQVFKPDIIHLGHDEVNTRCWNSNQELMNYTRKTLLRNLGNLFHTKLTSVLTNIETKLQNTAKKIVWQDAYDAGVNTQTRQPYRSGWKAGSTQTI